MAGYVGYIFQMVVYVHILAFAAAEDTESERMIDIKQGVICIIIKT